MYNIVQFQNKYYVQHYVQQYTSFHVQYSTISYNILVIWTIRTIMMLCNNVQYDTSEFFSIVHYCTVKHVLYNIVHFIVRHWFADVPEQIPSVELLT